MNDRLTATASQTVGPFFHFGLAEDPSLGCLVGPGTTGERIRLRIVVLDGERAPVRDALVEIYQADGAGVYAHPAEAGAGAAFCGFGRLPTDAEGSCTFQTIRPGRVPDGRGGLQAAHVNVCLFARGLLRHLYTRVYFAGDPALADDAMLAQVPEDRRDTLLALADPHARDTWSFAIRLQGDRETVFFDL
jgi:protocatechuate 3,4-dioxygenase alpha subunit